MSNPDKAPEDVATFRSGRRARPAEAVPPQGTPDPVAAANPAPAPASPGPKPDDAGAARPPVEDATPQTKPAAAPEKPAAKPEPEATKAPEVNKIDPETAEAGNPRPQTPPQPQGKLGPQASKGPQGKPGGPQQPNKPKIPVKPPASAGRLRFRHMFVAISFLAMVVAPITVSGLYLYAVAADQYASHVGFSVRTEEKSSAIELLGGITELSGSSSSDTDVLYAYLSSQEMVAKIDSKVDLRAIWSRVSVSRDPVFAYDPEGTIEDLLDHWERKVDIVYDNSTGMLDLRILAFAPEDARRIARAILEECSQMINDISAIAREDALKYAREELANSVERLKTAQREVTEFRNRNQIVDPSIDTQNQMGLLVTLQQQLAAALIEVDLLRETTRDSDPRIQQAQRRVEVIEARIDAERRKLGIGSSADSGEVFATIVGEYESLVVERRFAEESYTAALATYDVAQAEARRQSRYLAAHVRPTLAEKSEYPERLKLLSVIAVLAFLIWTLFALLFYSLRDRR